MSGFSTELIHWYQNNKRDLPWRNTRDPYIIWLSEIILQQTRVAQGLPYFEKFKDKFPTVENLAAASEKEVLRLWQGLGYYSRGRNLLKCAVVVNEKYGGVFPDEFDELQKLPGIGKYTAAAIASFAYGKPVPVVDGNVFRLLSRIFTIDTPVNSSPAFWEFFSLAQSLISCEDPASWNQAIMEYGAVICKPANPKCGACIFNLECGARREGRQNFYPVKQKSKKKEIVQIDYIVYTSGDKIWMRQRDSGIWRGLYEFYCQSIRILPRIPGNIIMEEAVEYNGVKRYRHQLSHKDLHVSICKKHCDETSKGSKLPEEGAFYTIGEVKDLPKPILIDNYLKDFIF